MIQPVSVYTFMDQSSKMPLSDQADYVCTLYYDLNGEKNTFYGYTTTLSFNQLMISDDFDSKRLYNKMKYDGGMLTRKYIT